MIIMTRGDLSLRGVPKSNRARIRLVSFLGFDVQVRLSNGCSYEGELNGVDDEGLLLINDTQKVLDFIPYSSIKVVSLALIGEE